MPALLYGSKSSKSSRSLYLSGLREITTSIYDGFKLRFMAPSHKLHCVAAFWHLPHLDHSLLAWRQNDFQLEQKVFIPRLLNWMQTLEQAREGFPTIIPSSIIFRMDNDKAMIYDTATHERFGYPGR